MFLDFLDSRGGGPFINLFLRVCPESLRLNFQPLIQRLFYVYGLFEELRGRREPLINVFLKAFFYKVCVLIFTHQNRVSF